MGYLGASSDSDFVANRLSSSNYVDPPSLSSRLTADTHHSESVSSIVPESVSDDVSTATCGCNYLKYYFKYYLTYYLKYYLKYYLTLVTRSSVVGRGAIPLP